MHEWIALIAEETEMYRKWAENYLKWAETYRKWAEMYRKWTEMYRKLESDTVVPTAVLPRVPAVLPRGRGHFWEMLRDYRGSGSQDDGDGMGMGMNFAGFPR